jgi:hypothetical protein
MQELLRVSHLIIFIISKKIITIKIFLFFNLVIGYILSLWTTILGAGLNLTIFDFPTLMPTWVLFYPAFNITRIFYHLTIKCGYESCINEFGSIPDELQKCIIILYISAFIYLFLGIYLYEVIPQQFGVRKSPFFCIEGLIKKIMRACGKKKKAKIESEKGKIYF